MTPLEVRPPMSGRSAPKRNEKESCQRGPILFSSSPCLVLLSVDASVAVPLLVLFGDGSNSDEEQREEQVE